MPAGTSYVSASSGCALASGVVTCTSSGLALNAEDTFTIVVHIDPGYTDGGTLTNTASIATNATSDPDHTNDSSTSTTTVNRSADLKVTKTAAPDPATAGTDETFTVTVKNLGPSINAGYTVTDAVPAGTTFVSASAGCAFASGTVTCTSAGLANGGTDTYTVVVHISSNYANGTSLSNTASIGSSATSDPNPGNNSDTATATVNRAADLADLKVAEPNPVIAGNTLTYKVTVTNNGPSDAESVTLHDVLDPALQNAKYCVDSTGGTCLALTPWPGSNDVSLGDMPASTSEFVVIAATVDPATANGSTISNTATVGSSLTPDPMPGNNSASTTVNVTTQADLLVTKTAPATGDCRNGRDVHDHGEERRPVQQHRLHGERPGAERDDLRLVERGLFARIHGCHLHLVRPRRQCRGHVHDHRAHRRGLRGRRHAEQHGLDRVEHDLGSESRKRQLDVDDDGQPLGRPAGDEDGGRDGDRGHRPDLHGQGEEPRPVEQRGLHRERPGAERDDVRLGERGLWPRIRDGQLHRDRPRRRREDTYTIVVHIDSGYADGAPLTNTASIGSSATADPSNGNNSSTSMTTVNRSADLQVTKTAAPDPATPGTNETFTVKVKNLGPSDNAGYTLTDSVPAGTSFVSASPGCVYGSGTVTCTSGGLTAGRVHVHDHGSHRGRLQRRQPRPTPLRSRPARPRIRTTRTT